MVSKTGTIEGQAIIIYTFISLYYKIDLHGVGFFPFLSFILIVLFLLFRGVCQYSP